MTAQGGEAPGIDGRAKSRSNQILAIIARETGIALPLLVPEATIESLGVSSLDLTVAIFELERHFDIEIPVVADRSSDAASGREAEFATVGDLVAHVAAAIERAHPPAVES